jgi:hypothetical protein
VCQLEKQSWGIPEARQDQRGWQCKACQEAVAKLGRSSCQLQEHRAIFNLQRCAPFAAPTSTSLTSTSQHRDNQFRRAVIPNTLPVTATRLLRRLSTDRPREAPVLLRPQQADFHATSARLCQRRGFQLDTQCVLSQAPRPPRLSPLNWTDRI